MFATLCGTIAWLILIIARTVDEHMTVYLAGYDNTKGCLVRFTILC